MGVGHSSVTDQGWRQALRFRTTSSFVAWLPVTRRPRETGKDQARREGLWWQVAAWQQLSAACGTQGKAPAMADSQVMGLGNEGCSLSLATGELRARNLCKSLSCLSEHVRWWSGALLERCTDRVEGNAIEGWEVGLKHVLGWGVCLVCWCGWWGATKGWDLVLFSQLGRNLSKECDSYPCPWNNWSFPYQVR